MINVSPSPEKFELRGLRCEAILKKPSIPAAEVYNMPPTFWCAYVYVPLEWGVDWETYDGELGKLVGFGAYDEDGESCGRTGKKAVTQKIGWDGYHYGWEKNQTREWMMARQDALVAWLVGKRREEKETTA